MSPRRSLICMLAIPLLLGTVSGASHAEDSSLSSAQAAWSGAPSLIAGTSRYDDGAWIHTDFVYDDYGADTTPSGQPNVVSLAPTKGDFRYPRTAQFLANAADIVEVRARVDGADLEVRVLLQTIVDPAVVAIWTDVNGTETIFTQNNAAIDAGENTVMFTLPGAAGGSSVSLNVGAGLHDGAGGLRAPVAGSANATPNEFTSGGPTDARLFDLAFNTHEIEGRGGAWNEDVQATALQAGDLDAFAQSLDVGVLASGGTTPVPDVRGYSVRLFESRQDLGEGMGTSFPQYRGRWQPYAVWVPQDYDGSPTPLFINMHSLSVHHNQYRGGTAPSASYKTLYEQYEAAIGAIVVTPLGRGPDGWYKDEALVDTLEVWSDALENFSIDADRVYSGGYSMGGYGTYRLTTLMPDAFAAAVSIVGPPVDGIWAYPAAPAGGENSPYFTHPQLENTLHVPFWITHGAFDELVPVTGVTKQAERFGALGHEYRYALHPAADHFSFAFTDEWTRERAWLAAHPTRMKDPSRITLRVRPASWVTSSKPNAATLLADVKALVAEIGTQLDGAYWISDVQVAPGTDVTGSVEARSGGIPVRQTGVAAVSTVGTNGPSPHVLTGQDKVTSPGATTDALELISSNVTALTVDVGRAGLPNLPAISVSSNLPVTITFVRDGVVVGTITN